MYCQSGRYSYYLSRSPGSPWAHSSAASLLLLLLLSIVPASHADDDDDDDDEKRYFCFSDLGGGTCTATKDGADVFGDLPGGLTQTGQDLTISGISFDFRSYVTEDDDDEEDTENEDWSLWYHSLRYCPDKNKSDCGSDNKISTSNYVVNMANPKNVMPWGYGRSYAVTQKVSGGNGQTYYRANISITLKESWLKSLSHGEHMIRFKVHGSATRDKDKTYDYHHEDIYTYITFSVPKQVKLTIADEYDFGTFLSDDFKTSITKSACAHVQGGGNFKLSTSSRNLGYNIKGSNNTTQAIAYEVAFGPDETSLINIPYGGDETVFAGDPSENCSDGDNMNLRVRLTELFESLSVKPADNYSDTLTLTISAQ